MKTAKNEIKKELPLPADMARHVRVVSGRVERELLGAAPGYERAAAARALPDAVLAAHKAEMVVRQLHALLGVGYCPAAGEPGTSGIFLSGM